MMAPDIHEAKAERPKEVKHVETPSAKAERSKEVQHDETPSGITDHAFEPKGLWFTLCLHCNLAESAHAETTLKRPERLRIRYVSDDMDDD